ncbi:MAG TPA: type III pantothenate kinase [Gemmatimonadaceae bacterium]|nr:type III pantothenate kinase [Gemmatimonadaceae bacterium]
MILVFDVGNTETTVGLFEGDALEAHWRVGTDTHTPDEFALLIHGLLQAGSVAAPAISGVAIGSVVPPVTGALVEACRAVFNRDVIVVVVDARAPLPIRLEVDEPLTVGADRIINTLAASRLIRADTIVVDFGTATTFDCITADGVFLGGIIAPGLRSSAETLVRRTSQLPATALVPPARALGKRTDECIRAGVMFGAADSIDGLVRRLKAEWPTPREPAVIATGGLAEVVAPLCQEVQLVDAHLTLKGLQIAYDLLATA